MVRQGVESRSEPLDPSLRVKLEPRFSFDFGSIRIQPSAHPSVESAKILPADHPLERHADSLARPAPHNQAGQTRSSLNFAGVRIHSDERAAESARALGARAYTFGRDIVFGAGAFAPHTIQGERLLAHELAHVAQQAAAPAHGSSFVQRQKAPETDFEDDPLSKEGFDDKDSIRVRPGPVRTTLIRPHAEPMKDVDGKTFSGEQPDDGAWIQEFLMFFNLGTTASLGTGERYAFLRELPPQRSMTLSQVVDRVAEQGALDGHTLERSAVIGGIIARLPAPPPSATGQVSIYLTYSIVRTGHIDVATGKATRPDAPGMQLGLQITWELHKQNQSGAELSWVTQATMFRDAAGAGEQYQNAQIQNISSGFQAAWVFSFLNGSLQLAPIAQALTGFSRSQQTADGAIRMVPSAQLSTGGQIVYVIPGTRQHLQIGGQAAAAFTSPLGAHSTVDIAPSVFLQWKF